MPPVSPFAALEDDGGADTSLLTFALQKDKTGRTVRLGMNMSLHWIRDIMSQKAIRRRRRIL